jgi:hypothetical protein
MTTVSHESGIVRRERPQWAEFLRIRELWGSLAITSMWIAALFASVFGSDFVSTNGAGMQTAVIPSGVFVALFAFFGSASVAKHAFRRSD